ncbi:hypothetical protein L218DRAFT_945386 [Marasmius fiardii PR-910]|nr:hypothetical protein L218DRAFT_945386 [Marasmius fiardii PR-910]
MSAFPILEQASSGKSNQFCTNNWKLRRPRATIEYYYSPGMAKKASNAFSKLVYAALCDQSLRCESFPDISRGTPAELLPMSWYPFHRFIEAMEVEKGRNLVRSPDRSDVFWRATLNREPQELLVDTIHAEDTPPLEPSLEWVNSFRRMFMFTIYRSSP